MAPPPLPEPLRPMLAVAGDPPVGSGWAFEFKWDGVRAIVAAAGERLRLTSRLGNDVTLGYPELVGIGLGGDRRLLLDGELVVLDPAGRPDFGLLQHRMHVRSPGSELRAAYPVQLYVFDALEVDGDSLVREPHDVRRERLLELGLAELPGVAVPPSFTDVTGRQMLDVARAHRLEGIVAKRRQSRYEPGRRSAAWLKTALLTTQEVVLGGWTLGEGRRASTLGALLLGAYDETGELRFLGHVGTGFTDAVLHDLLDRLEPLRRRGSPFDEVVPKEYARKARWADPVLVGEVHYRSMTHDGRLRHAVWRGLRSDRDPASAVLGRPG
jgi:bifunctional non-homologous end joining protein LigD